MAWNHRLVRINEDGAKTIVFREVFYGDDEKTPLMHGEPFMGGDDMAEIEALLVNLAEAVKLPILEEADFTGVAREEDESREQQSADSG